MVPTMASNSGDGSAIDRAIAVEQSMPTAWHQSVLTLHRLERDGLVKRTQRSDFFTERAKRGSDIEVRTFLHTESAACFMSSGNPVPPW